MPIVKWAFFILVLQSTIGLLAQSSEVLIKDIKDEFKRINDKNDLHRILLEGEQFMEHATDGGGELIGYFEKGRLVKMTEFVGLSYGTNEVEYYLKDDELFFVYFVESKFGSKLDEDGVFTSFDFSKLETIFEGRYYLHLNELVKKIEEGERLFGQVDQFDQTLNAENNYRALLIKEYKNQVRRE